MGMKTSHLDRLYILNLSVKIGTTLTFSQMAFVTARALPSFIEFKSARPRLKPRQVPLSQWMLQVLVMTAGSLLNNWAFAFSVPLTVQIIFRSGGTHRPPTPMKRTS